MMARGRMRLSVLLFATLATLSLASQAAETVGDAFAREFTFLKAQKVELEQRLANEERLRQAAERRARAEIEQLQQRFIALSTDVNRKQLEVSELQQQLGDAQDNTEVVAGVLSQMASTLTPYGRFEAVDPALPVAQKLTAGFTEARELIDELSGIRVTDDAYFLADGTRAEGQIVHIGNIARYAHGENGSGSLLPAGGGNMRLWNENGSAASAEALAAGSVPAELPIFIFEDAESEVTPPQQKNLVETIESGGVIGLAILVLGALGLLFAILRFFYLLWAGAKGGRLIRRVGRHLQEQNIDAAHRTARRSRGAIGRLVRDILGSIGSSRAQLDDVITESMIRESSRLDRMGTFILVIAAVTPLLGLLGTVTGMISTFDAITSGGTGDPKLLAGGISTALVTTMLGLSVAIPLLLIGNMLTGWATRIKDNLERNALHLVNQFGLAREQA